MELEDEILLLEYTLKEAWSPAIASNLIMFIKLQERKPSFKTLDDIFKYYLFLYFCNKKNKYRLTTVINLLISKLPLLDTLKSFETSIF